MSIHQFTSEFLTHYEISSFFANQVQGGQKNVYFPLIKGQKFVLKLFPGGKDSRFDREMEIYDKFKDLDGIPKVLKTEDYKGNVVVFEEYIEGHPLADVTINYLGDNDVVNLLLKDIFRIMKPIWEARYVHRDFKPGNIMIKPDGKPVVIDFGIARDLDASSLTGTGWQPKSWRFASPEQYGGQKNMISYRTDFFSLATLGYFLFHGKLPFGNSETEIGHAFQSKNETCVYDQNFELTLFCKESLRFSPVDRPRSIDDLFKLIP